VVCIYPIANTSETHDIDLGHKNLITFDNIQVHDIDDTWMYDQPPITPLPSHANNMQQQPQSPRIFQCYCW
jgi:hypothetical protein